MIRLACIALTAILAAALLALPARAVEIKEVVSPGGIKAWLVEERSIPFTALEIRFSGGASLDRTGKRGAINLMTAIIEEGAGDMDATEFAAKREELAASFGFDVGNDSLSVSAKFLTENRDAAIDLLHLALTEPRFDADAIERVRAQVNSNIASDSQDPSSIATQTFRSAAFGDHPYGSDLSGTLESAAALTRDDLLNAYGDVLALDRIFVSAVGDISAEELAALLDQLLDGIPESSGAQMPPRADYLLTGGETVVTFPTPQSVAIFGHMGLKRDDPDFFAAFVMNQILGAGGFGSRLTEEVREKRGLTYGISSYLLPMDHAELVMGQVASSNDRVAEAISVIRDEWQKLAENGVTAEELASAKTYLTGAYPLRFDGNGTIAQILVGMQMDDLPISYIDTRNGKIEAVTLEDIKAVAARRLKPEELHFVVVGEPEGLNN